MKKRFTIFIILVSVLGLLPINFSDAASVTRRLKGRILLQVESTGEAWYVNPDNEKRYYLGRPADAFQVMRELGLGISNKDFDSFNGYAPIRLSGKILLKVEDNGKAYYVNPVDRKMHYLGRPADAFNIMREQGLGITNKNLDEIEYKIPESTVQNIDCTHSCGNNCYPKNYCSSTSTFYCGIQNTTICCQNNATFCNDRCWAQCPSGYIFSCPSDGGNASCAPINNNQTSQLNKDQQQNYATNNSQTSELIKILDNLIAEKQRQNELIIKQMEEYQKEMNGRLSPLQAELDALDEKGKELGCSFATDGPITMDQIIGGKAQECNTLIAQEGVVIAKMRGITNKYSLKIGITPTSNFTTQQSAVGQHYEFYYDGYGSGSIYNTNNPTENYKIYCSYGKCDLYGN